MSDLFGRFRAQDRLLGLEADAFAHCAAAFLAELNAIHPFHEGNGRTQMAFVSLIAADAGHPLRLERLEPRNFLEAMRQLLRRRRPAG